MPPEAALRRLGEVIYIPQMNRYGFGLGLVQFREVVSAWMEKRFGLKFDPLREIVPLIGSKEGISHLALAYMEPGRVAIVPEPGYNSYIGGSLLSGGEVYKYALRPRTKFLVELDEIPAEVLKRAKILYLNYPNNPTAAIAPREYLERALDFCRENGILLVYDNAYSEIAFDGYVPPSIFEFEGAKDVAVEFHSFSKTYNMTGWRIGWAAGGAEAISALSRVKSFVDTGQFLVVQSAAVAALESHESWVPGNVEAFRKRRDAMADGLRDSGFDAEVPQATMYLWVPVPGKVDSEAFARRALLELGVVIMPGAALGAGGEGFFRVALTQTPERLREAAQRLGRLL